MFEVFLGLQKKATPPGQLAIVTAGTHNVKVPSGVNSISAVLVGAAGERAGAGPGHGGGLSWRAQIPVTPGETLTLELPVPTFNSGSDAVLRRGSTILLVAGCGSATGPGLGGKAKNAVNDGGGNGGTGHNSTYGGGGGAGGYNGNGGNGGTSATSAPGYNGTAGTGGAGGGGAGNYCGGGGGVGIMGEGASGAGGTGSTQSPSNGGRGGSEGFHGGGYSSANPPTTQYSGGNYGGGYAAVGNGVPGRGAFRMIWGAGRAYPKTNTGDVV